MGPSAIDAEHLGNGSFPGSVVGQVDQVAEDDDLLSKSHDTAQRLGGVVDVGDEDHRVSDSATA